MKKILISLVVCIVCSMFVSVNASTDELSITGEGSQSVNSVVINSGQIIERSQSNESTVNNKIVVNSNTGKNKIDSDNGGTIITGDSSVVVDVKNISNTNINNTQLNNPTPSRSPIQIIESKPVIFENTNSTVGITTSGSVIGGAPVVLGLSETSSDQMNYPFIFLGTLIVCFSIIQIKSAFQV